ncbi:conserved protein of unknown function [Magnetospirillum sp. XM-1]|uniref:DUF2333 family protein n=1 Tax=Magnetospirillum sp. XM-1 TaxID=1663591 RepID=UPI00073DC77B|nr:DUF2333 family protein [Magnetospirillum sp. XM-1]CUW37627.1 conserved protein of unknown function [Magnetospirillum sp. XM-1]
MTQRFAEGLLNATAAALAGIAAVLRHPSRRFVLWAFALVVVLVFPVAMLVISKVDDNPDFAAGTVTAPRSRGVAVTAALITRELDGSKWHANDPFFMPGAWLRDMPAFQLGLVGGLARMVGALNSEKGVAFGPNGADVNLNHAAGLLKYPGTVWKFDTHKSWLPTASAEKQYRNAQRSLDLYNDMVAAGGTQFERKPEALVAIVEALIRDLDEVTEAIDHHLAAGHLVLLDFGVDGVFYGNKGRLYAYSIVLRELGRDFEKTLADRRQLEAWTRMVDHLAASARLKPWLVWSAAPDSSVLPNHLAAQGYGALRVRMQAAELLAALK